ncbi:hypothetical protein AB0A63_37520 [Lentzea sp. NPDC042327]|uniref:hypothetical protein n=1 Tax=Lentzea sp. NPDC042327 TaxID=3154801 RepID=UPI0033D2C822
MKRFLLAALCLLVAACGTPAPATAPTAASGSTSTRPSADESAAVRAAFETYQKAVLAKDGAAAVSVLAGPIFDVYENYRTLALTATEQQLATSLLSVRLAVYVMRGALDPAVLRTASSKDVVKAAVDRGLVGEQGVSNLAVGEVEVDGDKASTEVIARGQQAPYRFEFAREDGAWKIDLRPLLDLADTGLAEVAKQRNLTPEQLLDQTLVAMYGPAKATELRKPLGR